MKRIGDRKLGEQLATILEHAADLVGRSPYPLVAAAEALGVHFESQVFQLARGARTLCQAKMAPYGCDYAFASDERKASILRNAAACVSEGYWP